MLKYVLKQFFNNKKSFILIVILLITFIITSISPYLTGPVSYTHSEPTRHLRISYGVFCL